jgi:hypothetical protein
MTNISTTNILHQADVEQVVADVATTLNQGLSAYEIAVAHGYNDTAVAWLASLVGAVGPTGPAVVPVVSTSTALEAVANAINTSGKVVGKVVFNSTTGAPVWATGTTAADVWNDASGELAHTPV